VSLRGKHTTSGNAPRGYNAGQSANVRMGYEPPVDIDNHDLPRLYFYGYTQPKYNASVANGKPRVNESFLGAAPFLEDVPLHKRNGLVIFLDGP